MPPADEALTKFPAAVREEYIEYLRSGNLKYEAARLCGVSYATVQRRRWDDPEFKEAESHALAEAREGIEKVLYDMAKQGDISAIKMWLTAHDRSTYADKRTIELDATPAAVELGKAEAYARIAELQLELAKRSHRLQLDEGQEILDVPSEEI